MRIVSILRIGVIALAATVAGRAAIIEMEHWQQDRLSRELCRLVGNYLETSSIRSAYEGIQQGILRSEFPSACVTVIDSEKSFGNLECVKADQSYHLTVCRVSGNRGIRAEVQYPGRPFVSRNVVAVWLLTWVSLYFLFAGLQVAIAYLVKRITEEMRERLFEGASAVGKPGLLAQIADWLIRKSGILRGVRAQTRKFEAQIKEHEARTRREAVLRAQKEIEAQRASERLEEIRRIRHDLGSPLSSFLAVQEQLQGSKLIRDTLSSGIIKIQKMLDRLQQAEAAPEQESLIVVEVLAEEVVHLLSAKFRNMKDIALTLDYDGTRLSPVMATHEGLSRVIENLLENAFDAVSVGGKVRVCISSDDARCKITVEDNGCGIAPENRSRLFQKAATFNKVNGTGLGLYQCRLSVEKWRGAISYEPLPQGSRFAVSLPYVQVGVAFVGLPRTRKLWVIDDDPAIAEVLGESGYEIAFRAATFSEGTELFNTEIPPDIAVLVDYRLDGENRGTDLIAGRSGLQQIFLCTSEYDSEELLKRARAVGVRVIPKPLCYLSGVGAE